MKRITISLLTATFLCAALSLAIAQESSQENSGLTPPPKVLLVLREFLKPGRGGAAHEKAESAFVQAFSRAKWPTHYFAATSLTGKPRVLFFVGFDSFESWEKDNLAQQKNATLGAALDRAAAADGENLSDSDSAVLVYNEEQSLRAPVDIAHMRYFEIYVYRVRPGHRPEWDQLVKIVQGGYEKVEGAHWAMFQADYGQEGTTFVVFIPLKSASESDKGFADDKQFAANLGEDGLKKLGELEAASVEFSQRNLFQFTPSMSYPREEWIKADPDFWKPKASAPAAKPKAKTEAPAQ